MQEGLRREEVREKVEILRGLCHLMEAPQRISLRYRISLNLRSKVKIKSLHNSKQLLGIGCLTLHFRREKLLIHQKRSQIVESVVKIKMVSALRGLIVALVVERVVTKSEIVQT